jgi:ferrous iron transport protein A
MKAMDHGAAALLHQRAGCSVSTGLDTLPLHAQALVTGLLPARDAQEHSVLLRLLEIGFLPGETVRVVARGGVGGDPIAVRVGQVTFALRRPEASMVQVQRLDATGQAQGVAA